jgi:hypothetical protein
MTVKIEKSPTVSLCGHHNFNDNLTCPSRPYLFLVAHPGDKKSKMGNILPHSVPKMLYFSLQNPKIQVVEKMVGCNLGGKNKKT